jgi:hypothetical protein
MLMDNRKTTDHSPSQRNQQTLAASFVKWIAWSPCWPALPPFCSQAEVPVKSGRLVHNIWIDLTSAVSMP